MALYNQAVAPGPQTCCAIQPRLCDGVVSPRSPPAEAAPRLRVEATGEKRVSEMDVGMEADCLTRLDRHARTYNI